MSDAPSLDALARLAAATARHLAALGSACVHPARPTPPRRCGSCAGCVADGAAQDALADGDVTIARGLVAAVDALRAERARRDALAAAVRDVGDLIAEHGCSCDCGCAHTTGEHTSACDPCLACRASDVVSPLLSGAAPDVVRAGVVRAYLTAEERWREGSGVYLPGEDVTAYVARRDTERRRVVDLHNALVAALAAAEGR